MQIRELKIPNSLEITPKQFGDDRGLFLEWYKSDRLSESIGHEFQVQQANLSVSSRGVLRGIHFADIPPSQAKFVMCPQGAVLDFVIDIRVGSPTFGMWDSVLLDSVDRRSIYIAEGLGHAFVALEENSTVCYLVTAPFVADREHGVNPLDEHIGLELPFDRSEIVLSPKDLQAPSLDEAQAAGLLPSWEGAQALYRNLAEGK